MAKTLAACISLTAALLAAPAGAVAADVVQPSSVAALTTVPAGGSSTLTLRCPDTGVALNAAVTRSGVGVTVRRSIPGRGAGDWKFRLTAADDARRRGVRAVLRCVRLALPVGVSDARLDVRTRRRPVTVSAGGTTAVQLSCGPAWLATGYALDDPSGKLRLASVVPSAHDWTFVLENIGAAAATADVQIRCLRRRVTADRSGGSTALRFRVARASSRNSLGSGVTTFGHFCGRKQFSLAAGSIADTSGTIELDTAAPADVRRGRWKFRRAAGGDEVRSFLVCLGRRSGFR